MAENNGTYALGRIGLNTCGTYDATQNYERLDVVNYCGSSYIAKRANVGVAPAENGDWSLMAKGNLLIAGEDVPPIADYVLGEHLTGARWIDGKPIYRYVHYSTTKLAKQVEHTLFTISHIDTMVNIYGISATDNGYLKFANCYRASSNFMSLEVTPAGGFVFYPQYNDNLQRVVVAEYTRSIDPDQSGLVTMPPRSMGTAWTRYGCAISCSGQYNSSSFPLTAAFDKSSTSIYVTPQYGDKWVQIQMPVALKNIVVEIYNIASAVLYVTGGRVLGSNDGATWTQIGSFSGWNIGNLSTTNMLGSVSCENSAAYSYVRFVIDTTSTGIRADIGEIVVKGFPSDD